MYNRDVLFALSFVGSSHCWIMSHVSQLFSKNIQIRTANECFSKYYTCGALEPTKLSYLDNVPHTIDTIPIEQV